jgi:hypothetical protein
MGTVAAVKSIRKYSRDVRDVGNSKDQNFSGLRLLVLVIAEKGWRRR